MERSPSAFVTLGEEALRLHFLLALNGHYEGAATGETFNYEGKSDILIRVKGRNIFAAECKATTSKASMIQTVDLIFQSVCFGRSMLNWIGARTKAIPGF